jgi:hypothetical protein
MDTPDRSDLLSPQRTMTSHKRLDAPFFNKFTLIA